MLHRCDRATRRDACPDVAGDVGVIAKDEFGSLTYVMRCKCREHHDPEEEDEEPKNMQFAGKHLWYLIENAGSDRFMFIWYFRRIWIQVGHRVNSSCTFGSWLFLLITWLRSTSLWGDDRLLPMLFVPG